MAKHDVTKTPFLKKNINEFLLNFGDRRHIDAEAGTEGFALIYAAVYDLLRKFVERGRICPSPPAGRGLR